MKRFYTHSSLALRLSGSNDGDASRKNVEFSITYLLNPPRITVTIGLLTMRTTIEKFS